jgi:BirA family biotin operon repressor/biotin-[acetyl-CoA-carboxylase] ligase
VSSGPLLVRLASVGSTMDHLHELAATGAEAGTVVVAGEQTAGRGSRGRPWNSPPGGLWLSALYRPLDAKGLELMSLRVGLAVAAAIEACAPGLRVAIKWPNDLMLEHRKVGGILCEARWQGEVLGWVVAGIGVNVANPVGPGLAGVTRLADHVAGADPDVLAVELAGRLRSLDPGGASLDHADLAALRDRDWLRGRRLRAPVAGWADGIAGDGALLVREAAGATRAIRAGTVEVAEPTLKP